MGKLSTVIFILLLSLQAWGVTKRCAKTVEEYLRKSPSAAPSYETVTTTIESAPKNKGAIFSLLGRGPDSIFAPGQSVFYQGKAATVIQKDGGAGGGLFLKTAGGTVPLDPASIMDVEVHRLPPAIRINSQGEQVAVFYRTVSSKKFSDKKVTSMMERGIVSAGFAAQGSGKAMRNHAGFHDPVAASKKIDVNILGTRFAQTPARYMPFTSNPIFVSKAFHCDGCTVVIAEVEVPISKVVTDSELRGLLQPDWRNGRHLFVKSEYDEYPEESEYTFTSHHLPARFVKKLYSIKPNGKVRILRRD